jgi:L-alanine-DL-glutamate epimerase-like enolase superfamily enzyme
LPLIERIEILQVDLAPKVVRTDAIQSFVAQETPIVRLTCDDGAQGVGYSYTIGTGGSSVVALLRDHLAPLLLGEDPDEIERLWKRMFFHTHATAVGAITSLALAAVDTALWDLRGKRLGLPLWKLAGGAQRRVPTYTTEGGWLHLSREALVDEAVAARDKGFRGTKMKVGKPHLSEDVGRLDAVRSAVRVYRGGDSRAGR